MNIVSRPPVLLRPVSQILLRNLHHPARTMSTDTFPPPALKAAAQEVATLLKDRKETISVAETAAGGLISAAILATPGASQIYRGGLTVSLLPNPTPVPEEERCENKTSILVNDPAWLTRHRLQIALHPGISHRFCWLD